MRKILFRGKRADNGEWVYGWLFQMKYDTKKYLIRTFPDKDDNYEDYVILPETIGQYTGFSDKNGKMIFEGDILDIHQTVNGYNQFVIEYDTYKFSARYYNQETKKIHGWYNYSLDELFEINEWEKEIEVIGNTYDKEVEE